MVRVARGSFRCVDWIFLFFIIFGIKRLDKLRLICQLALHFSFEQCETPFSKPTMSLLKVSVLNSAIVQLVNNT